VVLSSGTKLSRLYRIQCNNTEDKVFLPTQSCCSRWLARRRESPAMSMEELTWNDGLNRLVRCSRRSSLDRADEVSMLCCFNDGICLTVSTANAKHG